ncbi:MAG: hypothetical protein JSS16_01920 [Proteobacteria bacterium]|uniref:hypothetical protein n=1 Tax=Rudaea sp. TaxID=2136325 RepID=UPI001D63D07F|nr:hypothetical protein [Pseudomonadota bacterium]
MRVDLETGRMEASSACAMRERRSQRTDARTGVEEFDRLIAEIEQRSHESRHRLRREELPECRAMIFFHSPRGVAPSCFDIGNLRDFHVGRFYPASILKCRDDISAAS